MELRVCPSCKRHVGTSERVCPFCAIALAPARAQFFALHGRVARAAVFSAALAACAEDKPKPPAPAPAQGSDDLEKLLDTDERTVPRAEAPPPIDAGVIEDAAVADAAVPVDAGVVRKKKKKIEPVITKPPPDWHNAKPYGAPPARRRIV